MRLSLYHETDLQSSALAQFRYVNY